MLNSREISLPSEISSKLEYCDQVWKNAISFFEWLFLIPNNFLWAFSEGQSKTGELKEEGKEGINVREDGNTLDVFAT